MTTTAATVPLPTAAPSPFHCGEQAVQARAGMRERIEQVGQRFVRKFMPEQHRAFFEELPMLLVGSLDPQGRPWASALAGLPGFITSPDPSMLSVEAQPFESDPLTLNLSVGAPVGLLGIQLETRRRNRANGRITRLDPGGFAMQVEQSFGNCPKYIQLRQPVWVGHDGKLAASRPEEARLSPLALGLIHRSDTFFIATASADAVRGGPGEGVDISHRGGPPGFVDVQERAGRTVLFVPDYLGNFMFNSLGNIVANPSAGLLFIDFASGDELLLTGRSEVLWEPEQVAHYPGAQRLLRFGVEEGRWLEGALSLRWSELGG
jgi:predicted pyridoxine 5'-phosphate oxidase superfamily flavin-nucleotide-binding protein